MKKIGLIIMFFGIFSVLSAQKGGWRVQTGSGLLLNTETKEGIGLWGHAKDSWEYAGYTNSIFPYQEFKQNYFGVAKYWNLFRSKVNIEINVNYIYTLSRLFKYKYIHHGTWTEIIWAGTQSLESRVINLGSAVGFNVHNGSRLRWGIYSRIDRSTPLISGSDFYSFYIGPSIGYKTRHNHTLWIKPEFGWFKWDEVPKVFSPRITLMYDIDRIKKKK
ncbi:MAG: hypothetical protein K1X92_13520 [Bacteroidia bacterium]|nr:hypothetical protein [Bacteroidia bacterium]